MSHNMYILSVRSLTDEEIKAVQNNELLSKNILLINDNKENKYTRGDNIKAIMQLASTFTKVNTYFDFKKIKKLNDIPLEATFQYIKSTLDKMIIAFKWVSWHEDGKPFKSKEVIIDKNNEETYIYKKKDKVYGWMIYKKCFWQDDFRLGDMIGFTYYQKYNKTLNQITQTETFYKINEILPEIEKYDTTGQVKNLIENSMDNLENIFYYEENTVD